MTLYRAFGGWATAWKALGCGAVGVAYGSVREAVLSLQLQDRGSLKAGEHAVVRCSVCRTTVTCLHISDAPSKAPTAPTPTYVPVIELNAATVDNVLFPRTPASLTPSHRPPSSFFFTVQSLHQRWVMQPTKTKSRKKQRCSLAAKQPTRRLPRQQRLRMQQTCQKERATRP